jgi:hypothetical protein
MEKTRKYAVGRLLEALLPVKDSLEMGLEATRAEPAIDVVRHGMELTLEKLNAVLADFGVETIDPKGHREQRRGPHDAVHRGFYRGRRAPGRAIRQAPIGDQSGEHLVIALGKAQRILPGESPGREGGIERLRSQHRSGFEQISSLAPVLILASAPKLYRSGGA